jgi:hypothetical protein
VSEWDHKASIMRRLWPTIGCWAMGKICIQFMGQHSIDDLEDAVKRRYFLLIIISQ